MVYFQTKNPNLDKFWRALELKILVYFMTVCNILMQFGSTYCRFVQFVVIWYIFPHFGMFGSQKIWQPWRAIKNIEAIKR
jgi:hypothetical protein